MQYDTRKGSPEVPYCAPCVGDIDRNIQRQLLQTGGEAFGRWHSMGGFEPAREAT
jgi:hypothetical protein